METLDVIKILKYLTKQVSKIVHKIKDYELKQRRALDLESKVHMSLSRIRKFYNLMNGNVYVSFSGGKDSTVLLHLVRSVYPDVVGMFIDTGLEYPEIRKFVKTIDNIEWVRPKMSFPQVLKKCGYPVISKVQSHYIFQYRNTKSSYLKNRLWNGKNGRFKISEKWKYLVNAPFKISERCCYWLKKRPAHYFDKRTGLRPYLGFLAVDSNFRERYYLQHGCTILKEGSEKSLPLSFWTEQDIWDYIKSRKLPYCKIYDMGAKRTGCIFCMFGVHLEKEPNRFQRMKKSHPKLYKYCMEKLGIAEVLDYLKVKKE